MTEEVELPPQLQEQLGRLQQLQQTLQAVMTQKQQLEIESSETDKAISELDKVTDQTPVYKSVGSLLIKSDRQTLTTELKERRELLGTMQKGGLYGFTPDELKKAVHLAVAKAAENRAKILAAAKG